VRSFIAHASSGDYVQAVALVTSRLHAGVPAEPIVADLLARALDQVGEGWQKDELSVASEHLVSGAAEAALQALASEVPAPPGGVPVISACAEGDFHATAAHMFAQILRFRGVGTDFLGASTTAAHVAESLEGHRRAALVVSCHMAMFLPGTISLVNAGHAAGVPVLVGGRAFGYGAELALRLGADGWAPDADEAVEILGSWQRKRPSVSAVPIRPDRAATELSHRAAQLTTVVLAELVGRSPLSGFDARRLDQAREYLGCVVRSIATAQLVDDARVLLDFLDWLAEVLDARHIPRDVLVDGVGSLVPLLHAVSAEAGRLGELGLEHLSAAPGPSQGRAPT
jgi:methanogenic corrinoid protein MtbC1